MNNRPWASALLIQMENTVISTTTAIDMDTPATKATELYNVFKELNQAVLTAGTVLMDVQKVMTEHNTAIMQNIYSMAQVVITVLVEPGSRIRRLYQSTKQYSI